MNIDSLYNKHANKECVILTCGPSLTEYSKKKVLEFCKNKIIICVKEAIIEFKNEADYFVANHSRHRNFEFNSKTIKIYQKSSYAPMNKNITTNYDIILPEDNSYANKIQLLKTHNFNNYNIKNNICRPWGPGILYETVFYLCLYMGFKNVYTIGWDLLDTSSNKPKLLEHFFENNNNEEYKKSIRWHKRSINGYFNEMKMVNENIVYMYNYLKQNKMNLFVVGKQSYVNKNIPRIIL